MAQYEFAPGLDLRIEGARSVLRHFDAEYEGVRTADDAAAAAAEVAFVRNGVRGVSGGHKTVRWTVELAAGDAGALRARISLRGAPASFGLSLVQGYVVEPLVSLAAVRTGNVLLPAAALVDGAGATVLLGRSGTGKSSLSAIALARGQSILGDDQVLVAGDGTCRRFPRRLRFYSDLRETAPEAYRRLPSSARAALAARRTILSLTRGLVAPPVRVRPGELGPTAPAAPVPIVRLVLLERVAGDTGRLEVVPASLEDALEHARSVLEEQRTRLRGACGAEWRALAEATETAEAAILRSAFERAPLERVGVPMAWPAPRAVAALAVELLR